MNIVINPKFKDLIPPLSEMERSQLEANILAEGCREPLILWGDFLVDGHNRFEICQANELDFGTIQKDFASEDEAEIWIIKNQLGRRNVTDFARIELALKLQPLISAKAEAKKAKTAFSANPTVKLISTTPSQITQEGKLTTREELAKIAGVSTDAVRKAVEIDAKASKEVKDKVRSGELKMHTAYRQLTEEPKEAKEPAKCEPWADMEAELRQVQSTLRSLGRQIQKTLQFKPANSAAKVSAHYAHPYARFFSPTTLSKSIDAAIWAIDDGMPVRELENGDYESQGQVNRRERDNKILNK